MAQLVMVSSIWAFMPVQKMMSCALRLHLSAPRCDECKSWSMDERIEEETMTLLPLKRMP